MDRKEFRQYVKRKLKQLGFQSRKSCHYLIMQDDYLIGFELVPSSYTKGYYFECGCLYLPDPRAMPFYGYMDLRKRFLFPLDPSQKFDFHACLESEQYTRTCEYEKYTVEQIDQVFDANFEYYMRPFYNQEYGFQMYRENPRRMNHKSEAKIRMLCNRSGLDAEEVLPCLLTVLPNEERFGEC